MSPPAAPPFDPQAYPLLAALGPRLRGLAGDAAFGAGVAYFRKGAVKQGAIAGTTAYATVTGTTDYRISVAFNGVPSGVPSGAPSGTAGAAGTVSVTLPPGRDWTDVTADLATLTRLRPTGTLQGERVTGVWRRSIANGPFAYLEVATIDLAPHPDVEDVADLAGLKLRFMRNDSDGLQASDPRPTTVAGQPALEFDTVATRRFPGGTSSRGSVSGADRERFVTRQAPGTALSELIWYARDVVTIRNGQGYAFRLYSTGPGVKNDHLGDLAQMVAGATFTP